MLWIVILIVPNMGNFGLAFIFMGNNLEASSKYPRYGSEEWDLFFFLFLQGQQGYPLRRFTIVGEGREERERNNLQALITLYAFSDSFYGICCFDIRYGFHFQLSCLPFGGEHQRTELHARKQLFCY